MNASHTSWTACQPIKLQARGTLGITERQTQLVACYFGYEIVMLSSALAWGRGRCRCLYHAHMEPRLPVDEKAVRDTKLKSNSSPVHQDLMAWTRQQWQTLNSTLENAQYIANIENQTQTQPLQQDARLPLCCLHPAPQRQLTMTAELS